MTQTSEAFRRTVDQVAAELVRVNHRGTSSFISTPLLYPSGSTVIVRLSGGPKSYFVTDFGMGFEESEMMGAGSVYLRHARAIAEQAGVAFDQRAFFVMEVPEEQLAGAITTIANCSQEAVAVAAYKFAERKVAEDAERLYKRLVSVFSPQSVTRDAEVVGASNTKWHVATMVRSDQRSAIFEPVNKHHTSVVNASAKFHDIAQLNVAPKRIAVVRSKVELGTYLGVLSQAASVVEESVPDQTIRRLAA